MIRENIALESRKRMKEEIKNKMKKKMKKDMKNDIDQIDTRVTSEIINYIMTSEGVYTMNDIRAKHPYLCPLLLQCVVNTIERVLEVVDYNQARHSRELYNMYHAVNIENNNDDDSVDYDY
jgi:hypothetical protein